MRASNALTLPGRSPRGERGLKSPAVYVKTAFISCRSPRGERGLKWCAFAIENNAIESLPPRGAWIEILLSPNRTKSSQVATPAGSVD